MYFRDAKLFIISEKTNRLLAFLRFLDNKCVGRLVFPTAQNTERNFQKQEVKGRKT
jgi:hypothetical protein